MSQAQSETESTTRDRTPKDLAASELAKTSVRASFEITPVDHVVGDVAGVLGDHMLVLLGMFYPRTLCRKANVVVTELVQNVLENVSDPQGKLSCDIEVDASTLRVRVANRVQTEQWKRVELRVNEIRGTKDLRALVATTLRERRKAQQRGGLGLMRLAHENKFAIDAAFAPETRDGWGTLTVEATFRVTETA
jgi:hypothetical protein